MRGRSFAVKRAKAVAIAAEIVRRVAAVRILPSATIKKISLYQISIIAKERGNRLALLLWERESGRGREYTRLPLSLFGKGKQSTKLTDEDCYLVFVSLVQKVIVASSDTATLTG